MLRCRHGSSGPVKACRTHLRRRHDGRVSPAGRRLHGVRARSGQQALRRRRARVRRLPERQRADDPRPLPPGGGGSGGRATAARHHLLRRQPEGHRAGRAHPRRRAVRGEDPLRGHRLRRGHLRRAHGARLHGAAARAALRGRLARRQRLRAARSQAAQAQRLPARHPRRRRPAGSDARRSAAFAVQRPGHGARADRAARRRVGCGLRGAAAALHPSQATLPADPARAHRRARHHPDLR